MSRSKQDILDTHAMLQRLANLLATAAGDNWSGCYADAESLRRISMTLHRWHELECGDSNDHASWTITRGGYAASYICTQCGHRGLGNNSCESCGDIAPVRSKTFEHDEYGDSYLERHIHSENGARYEKIPDREAGARKRLAQILKRYPGLTAYVQGDPRGCALYILKPGDVPEGGDVGAYYSRGLAVHQ